MAETVNSEGDESGALRPVDQDRLEKNEGNSGIVIGKETTKDTTTSGTTVDSTQTAFIKIYQDAGVIGVSMLTLLVLTVLMGMFSLRLLKLYTASGQAQENASAGRVVAVEKLATAVMLLKNEVTGLAADLSAASMESRITTTALSNSILAISNASIVRDAAILNKFDMLVVLLSSNKRGVDNGDLNNG